MRQRNDAIGGINTSYSLIYGKSIEGCFAVSVDVGKINTSKVFKSTLTAGKDQTFFYSPEQLLHSNEVYFSKIENDFSLSVNNVKYSLSSVNLTLNRLTDSLGKYNSLIGKLNNNYLKQTSLSVGKNTKYINEVVSTIIGKNISFINILTTLLAGKDNRQENLEGTILVGQKAFSINNNLSLSINSLQFIEENISTIIKSVFDFNDVSLLRHVSPEKERHLSLLSKLGELNTTLSSLLASFILPINTDIANFSHLSGLSNVRLLPSLQHFSDRDFNLFLANLEKIMVDQELFLSLLQNEKIFKDELKDLFQEIVTLDKGENPIVLPINYVPTAIITNLPSVVHSTPPLMVKIVGFALVSYKYKLNSDAWSDEVNISELIDLTGLQSSHYGGTLYVIGKASNNIWQVNPSYKDFTFTGVIIPPPPPTDDQFIGGEVGTTLSVTKKPSFDEDAKTPLLINLTLDPDDTLNYNLHLEKASGTFSYTGLQLTQPEVNSHITLQGLSCLVNRVGPTAAFGTAGYTVEGRILPIFTSEFVVINFPDILKYDMSNKNSLKDMYYVQDILEEVCTQAGVTVTFSATNSKVSSFEFTGRFTECLSQLAQLACGELLQQNGKWFIKKRKETIGTFDVSPDVDENVNETTCHILSLKQEYQNDQFDAVYNLVNQRKDYIIQLRQAKLQASYTSMVDNRSIGNLFFEFGKKDAALVLIKNDIRVEGGDWSEWDTSQNIEYYNGRKGMAVDGKWGGYVKVENKAVKYWSGTKIINRGLHTVDELTHFYIPFECPTDASGLFYARGNMCNLATMGWNGTPVDWAPISPKIETVWIHIGDNVTEPRQAYFWDFTFKNDDFVKMGYYAFAQLEIVYQPAITGGRVDKRNMETLQALIDCIDTELKRFGVKESEITSINNSNNAWADYQLALTKYQKYNDSTHKTLIEGLWAAAQEKDRSLVTALVGSQFAQLRTDLTYIYNNNLPLPGNSLTINSDIPHFTTIKDCGEVQSVDLSGYTVTVTAVRYTSIGTP